MLLNIGIIIVSNRPYSTSNMNILLCDIIGKASPVMRCTNMVELSDSFKQLDTKFTL